MITRLLRFWKPARHIRTLAAAGVLVTGSLTAGILSTTTASAAAVHTIVDYTPVAMAPYNSSTTYGLNNGTDIWISCYLIGDTVSGPYGSENVWDMLSVGDPGHFVPDADVYTGSNSPIVPRCAAVPGTTIGSNTLAVRTGPGDNNATAEYIAPGNKVEITCYRTGTYVTGPYGTENYWDRLTLDNDGSAGEWLPDALVYTGSNSAVVPVCP
ncbi:hypothetical protein [Streptomyces sp. IBSBF 2435]|uniref:hypothetical protein n=1 Tax=Streptomyces sp. IBSBF 2435 TaxID=2903531 RepID=UPI002FDC4FA5